MSTLEVAAVRPRGNMHSLFVRNNIHLPVRRISIGEIHASARAEVVQTLLGSCVAVCLHDPTSGVGGMNHIMLPGKSLNDPRFGVHAMELLMNAMMKLGGNRRKFVAKSFGAGSVVSCLKSSTVGQRNIAFVREFLVAEGIPLLAERHGGTTAVQVNFRTDTGDVIVRRVDGSPVSQVVSAERRYLQEGSKKVINDQDVVLF